MENTTEKNTALQINRLILLLISIILAVSSVILLIRIYAPESNTTDNEDTDRAPSIEYALPRNAREGQNNHILWESNFGGSMDESGGKAYELNNKIYVFGTTLSSDYDCKGGNGFSNMFLSVFELNGRLVSTHIFGSGHNDTFVEARPHHTGFLILANTSRGGGTFDLYHFDVVTTKISQLQFNFPLNRTAVDLIYTGANILIIAEYRDTNIDKTIPYIIILDENYKTLASLDISHPAASLEYVDAYDYYFSDIGQLGYAFFMNAIEGTENFPCMFTLKPNGDYKFFYYERYTQKSKILSVIPSLGASGGFILLTAETENGMQTKFNALDLEFKTNTSIVLPMVLANKGIIYFNSNGYFISTYPSEANIESVTSYIRFNNTLATSYVQGLSGIGRIRDFHELPNGKLALISSTENDESDIFITILNADGSASNRFSFGGTKKERALGIIGKDARLFCFAESESNDKDIPVNFGKTDLWLSEVLVG